MVTSRSKPYRNARIIAVIRDLCFIGGSNSFSRQFGSRFPTFQHNDGRVVREVPVVMVALVATAVSDSFLLGHFVVTQIVSFMPASTSGVLAGTNELTSRPLHTLMFTMVI